MTCESCHEEKPDARSRSHWFKMLICDECWQEAMDEARKEAVCESDEE